MKENKLNEFESRLIETQAAPPYPCLLERMCDFLIIIDMKSSILSFFVLKYDSKSLTYVTGICVS